LFEKKSRIERLLVHHPDPESESAVKLKGKLSRIDEQYSRVRSNIASEREALCWLVARDLSVLVRQYGADRIRVEDLHWLGGSGQSWNFSQQRKCIETVADRYGILLEVVNACNSSHVDPSCEGQELAEGPSTDTRMCTWGDGSEHDRDDTASLELACRKPKSVSHDRDASVAVEAAGFKREHACEIVAVKPRGRKAKEKKTRCEAGRPGRADYSYRPDLEAFYSSIRERRRELSEARREGGESFSWNDYVVGASRSVALLRECRSANTVPSGSALDGVPAHPIEATQSSTDKIEYLTAKMQE
jgi:hypothetical protein